VETCAGADNVGAASGGFKLIVNLFSILGVTGGAIWVKMVSDVWQNKVVNANHPSGAMRPTKSSTDVRTTSMLAIVFRKMCFFTSSFDGSTSTRHDVIPVIHTILWQGAPRKNGDDAPLIVQYG
jgi:hypothetical protein